MRRRIAGVIFLLSVFLNFGLIYVFFIRGSDVEKKTDNRIVIKMTNQNREYIMTEMRSFLENVQIIQKAIISNDLDEITLAATASGACKKQDIPVGLLRTLPLEFKKLGMNTHDLFDQIACSTKENYNKEEIQEKLIQILNNCVSCHKVYKIAVH
ncbi:hypothetical protein E6C50_16110 [Flavobacterium supellecticarium]|uniref:Cytochrome C n=1 Tax=Flavobacterium supellecticarium TaxID=2565924 RepID=A0A4S3ZQY6_9FLAO|nr:hypothetical protein [Flavobacterium supellecticarium]THF47956.1 hypothetical protein E6C50_16110 [Flavobacterium supellecticarium]